MTRLLPAHNSVQGGESSEKVVFGSALHGCGEHGDGGLFSENDERQPDGVPDGDECQLVFGDGASLTMWQVDIPEKNAANPTGTFIRYADADGRIYQYDTDQLLFTEIAAILALP